jgi:outer membrane protein
MMIMKKHILTIALILATATLGWSQKFGYFDSEYVMSNIPAFNTAQEQLDKISEEWQKDIEAQYELVEQMYRKYQNERVLLTDEMKRKREEEIVNKERDIQALQRNYFGTEGELFTKRSELIKPIQDQIYKAVSDIATEGNYAVIFDVAASSTLFFTNPRFDLSDDVLRKLGYKN